MVDKETLESLRGQADSIDKLIEAQLKEIFEHPKFKALEEAWRGVEFLVRNTEPASDLQIKILNATKHEIVEDFDANNDLEQSTIWRCMYTDAFETRDGVPFAAVVADYEFSGSNEDHRLLQHWATVSMSCFSPLIAAASHEFFGVDSWEDIGRSRSIDNQIKNSSKWNSFRESEDSRFVYLTLPRTLIAVAGESEFQPLDERGINIGVKVGTYSGWIDSRAALDRPFRFCSINSAFVLANGMNQAYSKNGFCVSVNGFDANPSEDYLVTFPFGESEGATTKCLSEFNFSDRAHAGLYHVGFAPLQIPSFGDGYAMGLSSANKPPNYGRRREALLANENARIAAKLPFVMATSRIAHFISLIGRDLSSHFSDSRDLEQRLQLWISNYVSDESENDQQQFPFSEARIAVESLREYPGVYDVMCFLRPRLPNEELSEAMGTSIRIFPFNG